MARKKRGLQKNVSTIFAGVALQDVIHQGLSRDLADRSRRHRKNPQRQHSHQSIYQAGTVSCLPMSTKHALSPRNRCPWIQLIWLRLPGPLTT